MKAIGVIPARWASSRYPGKPLALIAGKPLIQWVVEGARKSKKLSQIYVATDDARIADAAKSFGAEVVMTSPDLPSGTDRVWAVAKSVDADIILNIQGDEPLVDESVLDPLVGALEQKPQLEMATLGMALQDEEVENFNVAKILLNKNQEAIYFSRFTIPYSREKMNYERDETLVRHIGLYAYRRSFLETFCNTPPTLSERGEALEQLRALYLGAKIQVVQTTHRCWGVDTPNDVLVVERLMKENASVQGRK